MAEFPTMLWNAFQFGLDIVPQALRPVEVHEGVTHDTFGGHGGRRASKLIEQLLGGGGGLFDVPVLLPPQPDNSAKPPYTAQSQTRRMGIKEVIALLPSDRRRC